MRIIFPKVILNLNEVVSIVSSAVIALGYTLFGGLISVAYTDVIQIFFIVFGLFLALPFALTNEHVKNIYEETLDDGVTPAWYGKVGKGPTLIQSQIRPPLIRYLLIPGGASGRGIMGGLLVPSGVWRNPLAVLLPEGSLQQDRQQGHVPLLWRRCNCPHHDRSVLRNAKTND